MDGWKKIILIILAILAGVFLLWFSLVIIHTLRDNGDSSIWYNMEWVAYHPINAIIGIGEK